MVVTIRVRRYDIVGFIERGCRCRKNEFQKVRGHVVVTILVRRYDIVGLTLVTQKEGVWAAVANGKGKERGRHCLIVIVPYMYIELDSAPDGTSDVGEDDLATKS